MKPFILIAGPCVLEDKTTALQIAEHAQTVCRRLGVRYVFKASYRKANRSKIDSFTGMGDEKALNIIQEIGELLRIETLTDIHESEDAEKVAPYVDYLQIPAFLCRQTDLLLAAGRTGKGVNIKKGQFLSPEAMKFAVEKVKSTGNDNVWVCERGNSFGYSDLIVDATSVKRLKRHGVPVIMDCTHSVQKPNRTAGITGGDTDMIETIALSAAATGADGFFIETHPNPQTAASDAQSMLQLDKLEGILEKCMKVRNAIMN